LRPRKQLPALLAPAADFANERIHCRPTRSGDCRLPDVDLARHRGGDERGAGTCIDPKAQIVQGRTVCVVSCQRSPEPVFLTWKGMEASAGGDFFVRSGPGTVKLSTDSANGYIRTRFSATR
jgi:hypothetical protein